MKHTKSIKSSTPTKIQETNQKKIGIIQTMRHTIRHHHHHSFALCFFFCMFSSSIQCSLFAIWQITRHIMILLALLFVFFYFACVELPFFLPTRAFKVFCRISFDAVIFFHSSLEYSCRSMFHHRHVWYLQRIFMLKSK